MSDSKPIKISLPPTAASHFNLYYYTAVLGLCEPVAAYYGSFEAAINEFPFLQDYLAELAGMGLVGQEFNQASQSWYRALADWEAGVEGFLPLRALQEAAGLQQKDLALLMTAGLGEEDPRFGELFEALQSTPGQRYPTFGLLGQWWRSKSGQENILPDNGQAKLHQRGIEPRPVEADSPESFRLPVESLRRLIELGLLEVTNLEAPRLEWILHTPHLVWDALRGLTSLDAHKITAVTAWATYTSPEELLRVEELILPDDLSQSLFGIEQLLTTGDIQALVVRGPNHNGRHTLLGALARGTSGMNEGHQTCRGLLSIHGHRMLLQAFTGTGEGEKTAKLDQMSGWRLAGLMATLLNAMPVVDFDLGPGETVEIPLLPGYSGPLGLVLPRQGGITGAGVERALTITLDGPGRDLRRRQWQRELMLHPVVQHPENEEERSGDIEYPERSGQQVSGPATDMSEVFAQHFRLTSGNIYRAAHLAQSYAALRNRQGLHASALPASRWTQRSQKGQEQCSTRRGKGRVDEPNGEAPGSDAVILEDVQAACRALNRQALDTLATYLPPVGDWSALVVDPNLRQELNELEIRCRQRERLQEIVSPALGAQLNLGVRALFSGASGTGKTLAARLLANALGMDLYRLDLAAVVNKYIGETEKNLNQVFARAEELDVILLLDEGDALLTQRTNVQTSNDRYANLETNYLLQRLEAFEGILLITTNAGDRIDKAFERRMDVVIHFHSPGIEERWGIWQIHLPLQHVVEQDFLAEVVERCELSGGQIRNSALYASLLALENGGLVTSAGLEAAVRREYRKIGAVCPLRDRLRVPSKGWS